ncbi:MAG: hypothetical protein K8R21_06200 [Leptospira sp.]|nr:hypothetical protein [Leptospira sp.]
MQRKLIQKILISFIFSIEITAVHCTFPLRNSQILESDTHLMLMDYTAKSESIRAAINRLKNSSSLNDRNNLAVFQIRNSELDSAEKILKELAMSERSNLTPLLNLIRLYYISDEYPELRKFFALFAKRIDYNKVLVSRILTELEKQKRTEEKVIILDALTNLPGFEMKAMEELGIYFTNIQNYGEATGYFEKILEVDAFNNVALFNLALISVESGKWSDVILYAGNISDLKTVSGEVYFFLVKANYELGNYREALRLADKAPTSEKESIEFMTVWRNAILASDLKASLSQFSEI